MRKIEQWIIQSSTQGVKMHIQTSTMTDEQITACFKAAWAMMEQEHDYCPQITFCAVYNYYNAERQCCEAWLTDGNCNMHAAVKYQLLCSYRSEAGK